LTIVAKEEEEYDVGEREHGGRLGLWLFIFIVLDKKFVVIFYVCFACKNGLSGLALVERSSFGPWSF